MAEKKFGQKREFNREKKKTKDNTYTKKKTYKEPVKKQQQITDEKSEQKKVTSKKTEKEIMDTASNLFGRKENNLQEETNISFEKYKGKKILVVDDNKLNIKVARRALQNFEFEIDEAEDGQVCLDKINAGNEYDLILMDIMMPNMSGEETIKKLKENKNFNTPVIALTADALSGAKEKYMQEGFADYIAKPFSRDQIKEKLDKIFKD